MMGLFTVISPDRPFDFPNQLLLRANPTMIQIITFSRSINAFTIRTLPGMARITMAHVMLLHVLFKDVTDILDARDRYV